MVLAEGREPATGRSTSDVLVARLLALAQVVADVAGATDLATVAAIVTGQAAEALGADLASLSLLDGPDTLRMAGRRGGAAAGGLRWTRFPVGAPNPVSDAVRRREVVSSGSADEIGRRFPGIFDPSDGERSLVVLPLVVHGNCLGAVAFAFPQSQDLDDLDRKYLGALADSCAQAVERIVATEAAADAARKLSFLADASAALARSLDYEATLRTVADLAVPDLADWCAIDLLEDGGLRRVAISHVDPDRVELAARLRESFPPDMDAPAGAAAVARTGVTELHESIDDRLLAALVPDGERAGIVKDLQLSSAISVALRARGSILGVLSLVYGGSGRHYSAGDVPFAEDLARRAAMAIDNAQLHSETLQVALQLQDAILPGTFEDSPTWKVAVHYRPAGRTEVGGDFYDALTLPDQRMVAVVGDVMGRGVEAAAAMAQTRSALRAYVAIDPDPATVIERLDVMFSRLDMPQFVTVLYALVDVEAGEAQVLTAGHLPPLVVHADEAAELLVLNTSPPLGLGSGARTAVRVPFGPDDTLVLFTDGLVERRGEDLDEGMRRLAELAPQLGRSLSDEALGGLVDLLRHAGHDDDVTLLAVRPLQPVRPPPHASRSSRLADRSSPAKGR